ncbi:hypothetical protein KIN20_026042 [Parelaphostrongylus tenuis]|uniref:Uncharacterized protein n=1 Tax=Parelaphostrongylus tenuis TaxID=148309 RepID=A0AAD5NCB7_PARTN|nr:hypothetical protein KIN20_026042 [Parelaphostrongylus tenuis]
MHSIESEIRVSREVFSVLLSHPHPYSMCVTACKNDSDAMFSQIWVCSPKKLWCCSNMAAPIKAFSKNVFLDFAKRFCGLVIAQLK